MKLTNKNVGVVIATYNRSEELDRTLSSLVNYRNIPGKILVVDQSNDNRTKKVVEKYKYKLPIIFKHIGIPSSSIAKNYGIDVLKKDYELILILDDDVDLLKGYLLNSLKEFNSNKKLMGLGGVDLNTNKKSEQSLSRILFKIFLLPHYEDNKYRIIGPYGNTSSQTLKKKIKDAQWLPGFNMLFRSKVFDKYRLPESIGYNVLEDIDSSYYVFRNYKKGSLLITPECKTIHRYSQKERYAEKKRIFVNHEDHFYFYFRHFPGFINRIIFGWSILGILIGNTIRALILPSKKNMDFMRYNAQAIKYAYLHRERIKKGILREFLENDRSMKKEYVS